MVGTTCPTKSYSQTCLHLDVAQKKHAHILDHFQTYQSHSEVYSHAGAKIIPYHPSSFS